MNPTYLATARLLTEVAPIVVDDSVFAVKGGTAINLFRHARLSGENGLGGRHG